MNIQATQNAPAESQTSRPERPVFLPASDIYETPDAILIRCDMPGVAEEDVEILLENKVLSVSGVQQEPSGGESETLSREYATGIYRRSFQLKRDLDEAAVKARLKNGVLEIEVPKAKAPEPRRIQVGG